MSTVCQGKKTTGSLAWFPLSVREVDGPPPAAGWPLSASGSGSGPGKPDAPKCHTEWGPF